MNTVRLMALLTSGLLVFLVVGVAVTGCTGDDVSAIADDAARAAAECMSSEESATLAMMSATIPAGALGRLGEPEAARDGLKVLDSVNAELAKAQRQAETAQRLYASIEGIRTSDANKRWARAMAAWAAKSGEIVELDVKQSEQLSRILNIAAADRAKEDGEFVLLAQSESNALAEKRRALVDETNKLAAQAKALAETPQ